MDGEDDDDDEGDGFRTFATVSDTMVRLRSSLLSCVTCCNSLTVALVVVLYASRTAIWKAVVVKSYTFFSLALISAVQYECIHVSFRPEC